MLQRFDSLEIPAEDVHSAGKVMLFLLVFFLSCFEEQADSSDNEDCCSNHWSVPGSFWSRFRQEFTSPPALVVIVAVPIIVSPIAPVAPSAVTSVGTIRTIRTIGAIRAIGTVRTIWTIRAIVTHWYHDWCCCTAVFSATCCCKS